MWPYNVTKADLELTYFCGSGAGGQRRNRRKTACRILHKPTGLVAESQEYSTGKQNREAAFRKLAEKLKAKMIPEPEEHEIPTERIRTYHAIRGTVKDHRTNRTAPFDEVLDGKLELINGENK